MFALQKCENCNELFSWRKIYKSLWVGNKPIKCENCQGEHRIKLSGRFVTSSLTILPMLIFTSFLSPFSNPLLSLCIGLIIFFIGSLFTPYFVKYTWMK
ncbi:TIGR04104 family putative zinc finger protein [Bacillus spongiae]|uniref:TIGR04104 family putative zinc finger protein n=1 Tax=Bacillus spongiae TaxID=2683610 RepID=UPI003AF5677D